MHRWPAPAPPSRTRNKIRRSAIAELARTRLFPGSIFFRQCYLPHGCTSIIGLAWRLWTDRPSIAKFRSTPCVMFGGRQMSSQDLLNANQATTLRKDGSVEFVTHNASIQPGRHTFANFDEFNAYLGKTLGGHPDG